MERGRENEKRRIFVYFFWFIICNQFYFINTHLAGSFRMVDFDENFMIYIFNLIYLSKSCRRVFLFSFRYMEFANKSFDSFLFSVNIHTPTIIILFLHVTNYWNKILGL